MGGSLGAYRPYQDLLDGLDELVGRGAEPEELGESVAGRPIPCLSFGPADATELSLVLAGVHAIEWIGVETALALADRLVDAELERRVLFVPVLNVDGYCSVEEDLRAGRRRFRRSNARGVDLNRNFPAYFKLRRRGFIAGWNFGGVGPRSEPEVEALCTLLERETERRPLVRALSLHSFSRKLVLPHGGRWGRPEDWARHVELARGVAARLSAPHRILQASRWVPGAFAHGMEIDHFHDHHGAASLLVECSAGGLKFGSPSTWLSPFDWFNPAEPGPQAAELSAALVGFVSPA